MGYATIADVKAWNPQRTYSSTSKPTEQQVGEQIRLVEARVGARIKAANPEITLPITGTTALQIVKDIVSAYTAAWAESGMFMHGEPATELAKDFRWQFAEGEMARIEKTQGRYLVDAAGIPTVPGAGDTRLSSFATDNSDEDTAPEMKVKQVW